jgi:hypothetical protein
VELLFNIKNKNSEVEYAKKILNIIWGALCERRINAEHYMKYNDLPTNNSFLQDYDEDIFEMKKYSDNTYKITTHKKSKLFVYGFARIGPFITAKGRENVSNHILNNSDVSAVKWIHTDGVVASKPFTNIKSKYDVQIGEFGYEGYCDKCKIKNANKVKGKFTL